jgi:RsiW-degrading membrane proteinase PrsW (M82 family)
LWTGILGGVLFMAARGGRLRFDRTVAATYLFVALLHAMFDSSIGALVSLGVVVGLVSFAGLYAMKRLWRLAVARQPVGDQERLVTALPRARLEGDGRSDSG